MKDSFRMIKAKEILNYCKTDSPSAEALIPLTVELASLMLEEARVIETFQEKALHKELAGMMNDPKGKQFVTELFDQCFRSHSPSRISDQMFYLIKKEGIPEFLSTKKQWGLWIFQTLGSHFSSPLISLITKQLRREAQNVLIPSEEPQLTHYLKKRSQEGFQININRLGEAILGETEASHRLQIYLNDLTRPELNYISVKISTICSQINLLAWRETLNLIVERLKILYRAASKNLYCNPDGSFVQKFVNLDMEEQDHVELTIQAFIQALDDPEFFHHQAGIVLQSYIPYSLSAQQQLTEWAQQRVSKGGAPIKIRIVKGANLAMEKVQASLKGWPQAPYLHKIETDAAFKEMVLYGMAPDHAKAVHLGIGSHNLFDIAYAMLWRARNHLEKQISFEMLEGMAGAISRVVKTLSDHLLFYSPIVAQRDFHTAIAYLIRRLDENTAPENFLHDFFGMEVDSGLWVQQKDRFLESLKLISHLNHEKRQRQNRLNASISIPYKSAFQNESDTDWSLSENRIWAMDILREWSHHQQETIPSVVNGKAIISEQLATGVDPSKPNLPFYKYALASHQMIDDALDHAKVSSIKWGATSIEERSRLLAKVASLLRQKRGSLIGAMVADTGKTISEADIEVSEAIDFAEYYRRNAEEIINEINDVKWTPRGVILVASPWNFPCSIPAGGILAALAAGNCVIFKPAPEAVLVGWELVQLFWKAGIPQEVLQFIVCDDHPVGTELIKDRRLDGVILTGSTETATLFLKERPGLLLFAETGGKNAMVITALSDRDLAVKELVQSAFGYAGQKCSACSLAICEAEVFDDPLFRAQLKDAVQSWKVGSQWDLSTRLNPLIRAPNEILLKALTTLEEEEEWLLEPKQDENNPNLWSPAIKWNVKAGSFSYKNELFGPVLGVMRANDLNHAIELANGTPYGLTAGLQSLDPREQERWLNSVEAGNYYINRGMTGAIVQRQPFGGCKESSFGPGAKAGGPNYVMQLMKPKQLTLPNSSFVMEVPEEIQFLGDHIESNQRTIWDASIQSYLFFWHFYFKKEYDPAQVLGQENRFSYRPRDNLLIRLSMDLEKIDLLRAIAAAIICKASLQISGEESLLMKDLSEMGGLSKMSSLTIITESEKGFLERVVRESGKRIRFLTTPSKEIELTLADSRNNVIIEAPVANGRVELLHYLREVSLSRDYHRYGYLGEGKQ